MFENLFISDIANRDLGEDFSLSSGTAGDLLVLGNYYQLTKDIDVIDIIEKKLKSIKGIVIGLDVSQLGLWTGPLGLLYSVNLINNITSNQFLDYEKVLYNNLRPLLDHWSKFTEISTYNDFDFDFIFGISGIFCCISNIDFFKQDKIMVQKFEAIVKKILITPFNEIVSIVKNKTNHIYPNDNILDDNPFIDLSFAHGITGYANSLIQVSKIFPKHKLEINRYIENINKCIMDKIFMNDKFDFPDCVNSVNYESCLSNRSVAHKLSWCRGLTGLLIYFNNSKNNHFGKLFEFLSNELQEINYISKDETKIGICHGLEGLIYTIYYYSDEFKENDLLLSSINKHLKFILSSNALDKSFLNGLGGVFSIYCALKVKKNMLGHECLGFL